MITAHVIQFLSRDCVDSSLHGERQWAEFPDNDFSLNIEIRVKGLKNPPAFSEPWPTNPSIGAHQFVDPYYKERWPTYLYMTAQLDDPNHETSIERGRYLLHALKQVCWSSFLSMPDLASQTDQRIANTGYRWFYMSPVCDMNRNPLPDPDGMYISTSPDSPIGPGFATLTDYQTTWTGGSFHELNLVWSQAISLQGATESTTDASKINEKALKFKRHLNSYDELRDAKNYSDKNDVKGVIRSSASAVDAALRYYCDDWGIDFPRGNMPYDEKIKSILDKANRPQYYDLNNVESVNLLHLYRARNSMHEGECYYKDKDTNEKVIPRIQEAKIFMESAERFVLWVDSLA